MYANIPIDDLLKWVADIRETEMAALDGNLPGSLADAEEELDIHEVCG